MVMDELRQENAALREGIQHLRERNAELEELVKQLTARLNQNSRNSSWPSSRDKSRKPKPKSQRKRSGRKAGGQKGHRGHTLKMTETPDEIIVHQPDSCDHCQHALPKEQVGETVGKRQVFDLPPLRYISTEHQVHALTCPQCGEMSEGKFPADVTNPVQYGKGVKQLAVYLKTEQFVPYQRSQQLLQDLFSLPVCVGSLQNFMAKAAHQVKPAVAAIKGAVIQSDVVHADETGFYIGGKRHWLHTASTPQLSYFFPHAKRGREAVDAMDILPHVQGTLVHDAWATYFLYETEHALCHAHHLRDLTAIIENDEHEWAQKMHTFLLATKAVVDEAKLAGDTCLPSAIVQQIEHSYDAIVADGMVETPPPERPPPGKKGRPKRTKSRCLVERFGKHKAAMLRFVYDFNVPFDNNLAERDIRMMKVQQKVSGCFRSADSAEQFCRLRSYTSTVRKQGQRVWQAIGSLFDDTLLMPQLTPV